MFEFSIYTYVGFRGLFKVISHLFFREIKITDIHNVPTSDPCIFIVGPHANQFIDGIVYMNVNPRPSYALMADVSYQKPVIGHVGKILNAIPVVRPQDRINLGTGKIKYHPPYQIEGQDTKFLTEVNVRDFILFGKNDDKVHVGRIISDTLLEITHAIDNDDAPFSSFKIVPHLDQTVVYDEVYHHLNNQKCITIFPEGGSHDRSEMLPLKAGFAIMALGTLAANPTLNLKIVPVGLNYFHPDRFRSRAVVSFGKPISIQPSEVENYNLGGQHKREAITKLLDQSDKAFKAITLNTPDYDTLMIIQTVRRLYKTKRNTSTSIDQVVQLNRLFIHLWPRLSKNDPVHFQVIIQKVKQYNSMLRFFGIRDHQVEKLNMTAMEGFVELFKRIIKLTVMIGLGTPTLISNLPLIWITNYISKRKQREALANSSVKLSGKDVLASWKVIVVAFAAPTLYAFYAFIYFLYLFKRRSRVTTTLRTKLIRSGIVWVIQPILHYLLMRLGDTGLDIYNSINPLILAMRNPEAGEIIRSMRKELSEDITEFVNKYAPEELE
ncbi:uncharacterized protein BX663DRAFT_523811 [Cokeromyces recurvatus]|uniref:uncharacterized protein n=1 Tax=Cokeromyces recurvatus TaxID=90255 RepID=UPI00221E8753|nr:uncharacterized protein BX663DRAFT_523811 [Cokeromyces recurvatus]KAI7898707.1 hypothetical protein BX663DRAFT_523811 [Cokeromyces recurvatus]